MTRAVEMELPGIEGSNPLAFLASLGIIRTLSLAKPEIIPEMGWKARGHWIPWLQFSQQLTRDEVLDLLLSAVSGTHGRSEFTALGDDLSIAPAVFMPFAKDAAESATMDNRTTADYAAAFGSEVTVQDNGVIQDTALRTMAGAGHQHFLGSMRNVIQATRREHLDKTLFHPWKYDDPLQTLSLRWDPLDDIRYALQWKNPSGDPSRRTSGSMLGANRLAIEGLPLLPTAAIGSRLHTTGFQGTRASNTFWTWPIWEGALSLDVIRSVLALQSLQQEVPGPRAELSARGIVEVFRSQRLTIGKVRNFTPGRSV